MILIEYDEEEIMKGAVEVDCSTGEGIVHEL